MKTEKEIKEQLKSLKNDERIKLPVATIDINAPLALIQLEIETNIKLLKWILEIET